MSVALPDRPPLRSKDGRRPDARKRARRAGRPSCSNGPLNAFETTPFDRGTTAIARTVAGFTRTGALRSVAGGGDTVAALKHAGVASDFSFVSTAEGAFLEWFEGRSLPGIEALRTI
ncbi:MAG: phosphoglycerate kinase [Burkholderiaceae bacterium]|nr:phosphoglycerate kinase [Burkholderiaceae bacterium]